MSNSVKYFVGNWKMFGNTRSFKIIDKIDQHFRKDKKNNRKYKVILAPPFTLLQDYSRRFQNKKVIISAQNCYHKDNYGAFTGQVSPYMIKKMGIRNIIIGHSENRSMGETNQILEKKFLLASKNNLKIIYCIGENSIEKRKKKTLAILKKQISSVIKKKHYLKKVIFAYEPVWSIGSGKVPSTSELKRIVITIKNFIKQNFKSNSQVKLLYGGSVDQKTIHNFKSIKELDGFLIGGASKSSKNFIDIIKNFYK